MLAGLKALLEHDIQLNLVAGPLSSRIRRIGATGVGDDDTIEREIFIRAGIDRVWSLVSEEPGSGSARNCTSTPYAAPGETVVIETARTGSFPVRVDRLEPPRYAAFVGQRLSRCQPDRGELDSRRAYVRRAGAAA